jgi:hypothetical protein
MDQGGYFLSVTTSQGVNRRRVRACIGVRDEKGRFFNTNPTSLLISYVRSSVDYAFTVREGIQSARVRLHTPVSLCFTITPSHKRQATAVLCRLDVNLDFDVKK